MQNETTILRLCTDIPVGTLSVHCVTCHGPNRILSAVFRIWFSPLRSTAVFYKKYFKDVSREFDEFQVNTQLCKLRCWYL